MSKDKLSDYSASAASNTDIGGISTAEGVMLVSDLNNAIREQMSHLKDFSDGTAGIDVLNLHDNDESASIKLQAPAVVTTTTTFTLPDGDGTTGQSLTTNGSGTLSWGTSNPAGIVLPFAGASAPSGYLLCYGQAVNRTTYATLFAAISTTYGVGDGSTTFNLPDLRGRVVAGQDDMGGVSANRLTSPLNGDTLAATGGSESHTLTVAEMPSHRHETGAKDSTAGQGAAATVEFIVNYDNTVGTPQTSNYVGGGGAHNNVQPTIILNYIIKT